MRKGALSLLYTAASQVLQSGTSFLVTLGFAQLLPPDDFGHLAGVWLVWMLILSFNRSVFAEQLLSQGLADKRSVGYGAFFIVWISGLTCLTVAFLVGVQMPQLLPGALYMAGFVGSDAIRYWFFAGEQVGRAVVLLVEATRFAFAALFITLAMTGFEHTPNMWLSAVIALVWPTAGFMTRRNVAMSGAMAFIRGKSRFEFLLALQYFFATGISQLLPLMALPMYGSSSFGGMRLTQSSLSPLALLGTAFQPGMIKVFGAGRDRKTLIRNLVIGVSACSVVACLMGVAAFWAVRVTGQHWLPKQQLQVVQELSLPVIVALTFVLIGQPGGAVIRVLRLGGLSLAGQVIGIAASAIAFYMVLINNGNLQDFVWAVSIGTIGTVVSTYILLGVHLGRSGFGRHAHG
ncbi:hypothetical protein [Pseudarthrobacter sp. L1SW]|uniref:hypothetical protein n=1 Tax=Pseudarthrobacter sp. L1SW TaxID=2851598 RepID=UPI001E64A4CC|nr:hypothetical protein [Pseudarthrobacter sp. L1SW]UEL30564.1 hypothetical protein KTR40_14460 [Pseudarthrobacter sp. L1SW]